MLIDGDTFDKIAAEFKVSKGALVNFVYQDDYSVRTREILKVSSEGYVDMAEQVLLDAPSDMVEIVRAKELSQFYRWKAAKRNPKDFGDNKNVTLEGKVTHVVTTEQLDHFLSTAEQNIKKLQLGVDAEDIEYDETTEPIQDSTG